MYISNKQVNNLTISDGNKEYTQEFSKQILLDIKLNNSLLLHYYHGFRVHHKFTEKGKPHSYLKHIIDLDRHNLLYNYILTLNDECLRERNKNGKVIYFKNRLFFLLY
jgi:hypothetical protein